MKAKVYSILFLLQFTTLQATGAKEDVTCDIIFDIIVYGGTSSGIAAAIQADRLGKSVLLIEPSSRIGGLTTGGLGQTDIGNKQVVGGISREFYQNIRKYYDDESNWKWQKKSDYKDVGQSRTSKEEKTMWTFEPSAALEVFQKMINDTKITVVYNQRLNLKSGVVKIGNKITSIVMESGEQYKGKVFIDATYEGDLMAVSGVSYTVGRESNAHYKENLNGVETTLAKYHQFPNGIDPYIRRGDPSSGFLPNVNPHVQRDGTSDRKIQAYCYRMCLTDADENSIPFEKPDGYFELEYELLFRAIEAGVKSDFFKLDAMPNRKTDSNNQGPFSTDYIGRNYNYAEGDYETRDLIKKEHQTYQLGLLWTLANHPRIPQNIRQKYSQWGLPKDEFRKYGNWTPQLYVREVRRMVSDFVMTENHCTQKILVNKAIGMGAYTMDSHHVQRFVTKEGFVKNEGDVQVGGFGPYPIGYDAIVPKKEECSNLLVPVCLSATHMAFGSIRMEPVFMVLGQSSAIAASLAIDKNISVQDVKYNSLKKLLVSTGQILKN